MVEDRVRKACNLVESCDLSLAAEIINSDLQMANIFLSMLKMCLDSLVSENADLARQVFIDDDEVDELRNQVYTKVIQQLNATQGHAASLLDLYLLSRHPDRIGDRTNNIAEGDFLSHLYG